MLFHLRELLGKYEFKPLTQLLRIVCLLKSRLCFSSEMCRCNHNGQMLILFLQGFSLLQLFFCSQETRTFYQSLGAGQAPKSRGFPTRNFDILKIHILYTVVHVFRVLAIYKSSCTKLEYLAKNKWDLTCKSYL